MPLGMMRMYFFSLRVQASSSRANSQKPWHVDSADIVIEHAMSSRPTMHTALRCMLRSSRLAASVCTGILFSLYDVALGACETPATFMMVNKYTMMACVYLCAGKRTQVRQLCPDTNELGTASAPNKLATAACTRLQPAPPGPTAGSSAPPLCLHRA